MNKLKINKRGLCIVLFCIGVLFVGLGAGISFVEYSGFRYGGELTMADKNRVNKEVVLKWDEVVIGENKEFHYFNWTNEKVVLVGDEEMTKDKIIFDFSYDKDTVEPQLREDETKLVDSELAKIGDKTWIYESSYLGNSDWKAFMHLKDRMLKGLKNGVYYDYENQNNYLQCTIRVSPEKLSKVIEHKEGYVEN